MRLRKKTIVKVKAKLCYRLEQNLWNVYEENKATTGT